MTAPMSNPIACMLSHRSAALFGALTAVVYLFRARAWSVRRTLLSAAFGGGVVLTNGIAAADSLRRGLPSSLQWAMEDIGRWPVPRLGGNLFPPEAIALALALPLLALSRIKGRRGLGT